MLFSIAYYMLMPVEKLFRNRLSTKRIQGLHLRQLGLFECEEGLFEYSGIP